MPQKKKNRLTPQPTPSSVYLGADDEKTTRLKRLDELARAYDLPNRSALIRALADGGRVENGKLVLDRPADVERAS